MKAKIAALTSSDRASKGIYEDLSGKEIESFCREVLTIPFEFRSTVVPDNEEAIRRELIRLTDEEQCHLILTTGGTGPAPSDVTPEATRSVIEKELPGFGEQMRAISLKYVPTAILSRQIAGIRKQSLIVNLPGQPKSIRETLNELFAAIPYCIELIGGPFLKTDPKIIKAFRPKSAPPLPED